LAVKDINGITMSNNSPDPVFLKKKFPEKIWEHEFSDYRIQGNYNTK